MMKDCKQRRTESRESCHVGVAKQVTAERESSDEPVLVTDLLYSSDSDDGEHVKLISVTDGGSRFQLARVDVQGVPADGVIDTGADITIMGKELFAMVTAAARLRKRDFRKADTVPRTYDRKIFHLDGCMDLDISFADKKMKTTVYIKADAHDQLLLSEGVCRQLGIVTFHPMVQPQKVKKRQRETSLVPTVRVNLVKSLHLFPHQSAVVQVNFEGAGGELKQPMMVESGETAAQTSGLTVEDAVTAQREDGCAQLVITNSWGFTQSLPEGTCVGHAEAVEVVDCESDVEDQDIDLDAALLRRVTSLDTEERKRLLFETLKLPDLLPAESDPLKELLAEHHDVFSLEEGERGETDLTKLEIDTGEASPVKQPPRRMPFMVRQEVTKQLAQMQQSGVIRPSRSPWSSPVVIVRKKDGTHRFCVDYRGLNAVTKPDAFPLPRISDILDQLGGAQYFSTLDLASGF